MPAIPADSFRKSEILSARHDASRSNRYAQSPVSEIRAAYIPVIGFRIQVATSYRQTASTAASTAENRKCSHNTDTVTHSPSGNNIHGSFMRNNSAASAMTAITAAICMPHRAEIRCLSSADIHF